MILCDRRCLVSLLSENVLKEFLCSCFTLLRLERFLIRRRFEELADHQYATRSSSFSASYQKFAAVFFPARRLSELEESSSTIKGLVPKVIRLERQLCVGAPKGRRGGKDERNECDSCCSSCGDDDGDPTSARAKYKVYKGAFSRL